MSPERLNVAVFGTGPAGLSSAMEIAKAGHNVEVITPEVPKLPHSVYSTNRLLPSDLVEFFFPDEFIQRVPYLRVLTSNGTDFRIDAKNGRYFMVNYPSTLNSLQNKLSQRENVHFSPLPHSVLKDVQVEDHKDGVTVVLDGQRKRFDLAVDATGTQGKVDEMVNPNHDSDFLAEYVYGGTFKGNLQYDEMILIIGPAGGTSWASPSIEGDGFVDIVFSAYGPNKHFPEFLKDARTRLNKLVEFISKKPGVEIQSAVPEHSYAGLIRSQPTKTPLTKNVYAVGEAAGMAKPSTGDSIQRAIIGGRLLAESLQRGDSPNNFYRRWRKLWNADNFLFAGSLARLPYQEKGNLGGTFDQAGAVIRNSNAEDTDRLVTQLEKYIVDGKLSFGLLVKFLSSRKSVSALTAAVLKQLELQFKQPVLPNTLPLPDI